jgi:hypothetical protein
MLGKAGGLVAVNVTDDIIWELQDQVQGVGRMVAWLVSKLGGDPDVIRRPPASPEDTGAAST